MSPPFHPQSVYPSAIFPSFHLPHTETHPWGSHPPLVPYSGQPCYIVAPVSVFVHFSQIILYFIVQMPLCLAFTLPFCCHPWHPSSLFLANATHVSLGWGTPYHLPLMASSISFEYPTGHLPMPSEFFHFVLPLAQLIPCLVVPLTLDLVERLQPLFTSHIPPTKGSIESSYILTSSMYLFQNS
jgi:hypothetical protein